MVPTEKWAKVATTLFINEELWSNEKLTISLIIQEIQIKMIKLFC